MWKKFLNWFRVEKTIEIKSVFSAEEIVIKDLLLVFWERRIFFIIPTLIMGTLGVVAIQTTEKVYVASTKIMSEVKSADQRTKRFSGLAGLAGIDLNDNSNNISNPTYYPDVVSSNAFLWGLLDEKFRIQKFRTRLTLEEYYLNYEDRNFVSKWFFYLTKFQLPPSQKKKDLIKSLQIGYGQKKYKRADTSIIKFSPHQMRAMSNLRRSIEIVQEGQLVEVMTKSSEKELSAELNKLILDRLIEFVTEYQTRKERKNLEYAQLRVDSAKANYNESKRRLANFMDSNSGRTIPSVRVNQDALKTELEIDLQIYRQLSLQLEQSKIALQLKTPVYTIFEPLSIPQRPEKSNSLLLFLGYVFGGLVIGFLIFLFTIINKLRG